MKIFNSKYRDAIVNPANENLNHAGGAARAIAEAAGENFHKECNEYIQNNSILPSGKAMVTDAGGSLKCDYVIHTVGPIFNKQSTDTHREEQLLIEAVKSCLKQMKANEFDQISIPAISSGIYGMPLKTCVKLFASAISDYLSSDPQFFEGKEIILCNFDDKTTNAFSDYFEDYLNSNDYDDDEEDNSGEEETKKETKSRKKKKKGHQQDYDDESGSTLGNSFLTI